MNRINLLKKAKELPKEPGCYLMKNNMEEVIYVGKANSLKSRVSSYFNESAKNSKTKALISHIVDFEFMLTGNESEAFIVENNLIKKHTPKYNILMRDDRTYPYIIVNWNDEFPRLYYTRKVKPKKNLEIVGPFTHGSHLGEIVRLINKSFLLRDCSNHEFKLRKEPCLLFQIKQCSAPCVNLITKQNYKLDIKNALKFLKNKPEKMLNDIEDKMLLASEHEEFERAAMLRDSLEVLNKFSMFSSQKNAELLGSSENIDMWGYFVGEKEVEWGLYLIRNGRLLGQKSFYFHLHYSRQEVEDELTNLIYQYYQNSVDPLPQRILVNLNSSSQELLSNVFENIYKVKIEKFPKKMETQRQLVCNFLQEKQVHRIKTKISEFDGLKLLGELLALKESPRLLECYDIALFQGSSPTAAQIVFKDGKPLKERYRHFKLKELPEGNNDFAMMRETLERRIKHGELPDIFIVDGGTAQINVFINVLKENNIDIPVVGIAKSRNKLSRTEFKNKKNGIIKTDERLVISGRLNPFILKKHRGLLKLLTGMRDEAHRFSRRLHHKLEHNRVLKSSWVDNIKGVGKVTKQKVLESGISKSDLAKLSVDELKSNLKISLNLAKLIKDTIS